MKLIDFTRRGLLLIGALLSVCFSLAAESLVPSITIQGPAAVCTSSNLVITGVAVNVGDSPLYKWYVDDKLIETTDSAVWVIKGYELSVTPGNHSLYAQLQTTDDGGTLVTATSNTIIFVLEVSPFGGIDVIFSPQLACAGSPVTIKAKTSGGGQAPLPTGTYSYSCFKLIAEGQFAAAPDYDHVGDMSFVQGLPQGLYYYKLTITNSCGSREYYSQNMVINEVPEVVINGSTNVVAGQSHVYRVLPILQNAAVTWNITAGGKVLGQNDISQSMSASFGEGNATITATVTSDRCANLPSVTYTVNSESGLNSIRTETLLKAGVFDKSALQAASNDDKLITSTYYDGLGNAIQSINWQASPNGGDIITPIVYDGFGRVSRQYLPATVSDGMTYYRSDLLDTDGNYTVNTYSNASDNVADDGKPYSIVQYEPSPLNRVLKKGGAGEAWQPTDDNGYNSNDHTTKLSYETNGVNEVLYFTFEYPDANSPKGQLKLGNNGVPAYYEASDLVKNRTRDEHNNEVIEYVDKKGHTILRRVQAVAGATVIDDTNYASTYYVYDDFGSLVTVLPPEAVVAILKSIGQ